MFRTPLQAQAMLVLFMTALGVGVLGQDYNRHRMVKECYYYCSTLYNLAFPPALSAVETCRLVKSLGWPLGSVIPINYNYLSF